MYDFEKTYWCSNGKHEKKYEELFNSLVPARGMANTTDGEALRAVSKIYYDAYNNGAGNFDVIGDRWVFLVQWLRDKGLTPEVSAIETEFARETEEDNYWAYDGYEDDYYSDIGFCSSKDDYRELLDVDDNGEIWEQLELLVDLVIETIGSRK